MIQVQDQLPSSSIYSIQDQSNYYPKSESLELFGTNNNTHQSQLDEKFSLFSLNEQEITKSFKNFKKKEIFTTSNTIWSVEQKIKKENLQFHAVLISEKFQNSKQIVLFEKPIQQQIIRLHTEQNASHVPQIFFFNQQQGTINYFYSIYINQQQLGKDAIDIYFQNNIETFKQIIENYRPKEQLKNSEKSQKIDIFQVYQGDISLLIQQSIQDLYSEKIKLYIQQGINKTNFIEINLSFNSFNSFKELIQLNQSNSLNLRCIFHMLQSLSVQNYIIHFQDNFFEKNMNDIYIFREPEQQIKTLQQCFNENNFIYQLSSKLLIIQHICEALRILHQNNIIHTCINFQSIIFYSSKPNNPILSNLEKAYFTDNSNQWKFQNEKLYKPPELKHNIITEKFDVYQLGVLALLFIFSFKQKPLSQNNITQLKPQKETDILLSIFKLFQSCIFYDITTRPSLDSLIFNLNQLYEEMIQFK